MNPITFLFYALSTIVGNNENPTIMSMKATVTVNPQTKTIEILQEDIFFIAITPEDRGNVEKELKQILTAQKTPKKIAIENIETADLNFLPTEKGRLNASIRIKYSNKGIPQNSGLDYTVDNNFELINIPEWNIKTTDGKVDGNYLVFKNDKPFSFSIEAFKNIPEQYKKHSYSLFEEWKKNSTK